MNDHIKHLQQRIEQVTKDLNNTLSEDNSEKKRATLSDYLEYLKDELRMAQENVNR